MERVRNFVPLIVGGLVAVFVFFLSRAMQKSKSGDKDTYAILEKAREAKLAKSILKKSENENSQNISDQELSA